MSVLIKGMEKPEHCGYCRFRYDGICHALQKTQYSMNECPLVVIDDAGLNDTISRQAAIDAVEYWHGVDASEALEKLPSVEPEKEKAKRVLWTGWKGCRDTRYKCPNCQKPVRNDDVYCHRCGQKLMFPHISFTDYIPGEEQELIVRWDDE